MRNVAQRCLALCLAANNILLIRIYKTTLFSFLRPLLRENGSFPKMFIEKQTR